MPLYGRKRGFLGCKKSRKKGRGGFWESLRFSSEHRGESRKQGEHDYFCDAGKNLPVG